MQPRGFPHRLSEVLHGVVRRGAVPGGRGLEMSSPNFFFFILRFALSALFSSSSRYVQALALGRFYFGRSRGLIFLPVSRADRYNARTLRGGATHGHLKDIVVCSFTPAAAVFNYKSSFSSFFLNGGDLGPEVPNI